MPLYRVTLEDGRELQVEARNRERARRFNRDYEQDGDGPIMYQGSAVVAVEKVKPPPTTG